MGRKTLLFFIIVFLVIVFGNSKAKAYYDESMTTNKSYLTSSKTIWVPDNFTSISDAVYHASAGDTIRVRAGVYYESVYIWESISLFGESPETTIIDANYSKYPICGAGDNITISGFTFRNSRTTYPNMGLEPVFGWPCGVLVSGFGHNISGNIITNNIESVYFWGGQGSILRNNDMVNNVAGVELDRSYNNTLSGNFIANNTLGYGIRLIHSSNNTITRNIITKNFGGIALAHAHNNTVSWNSITSNEGFGIYIQTSSNNEIFRNDIRNDYHGIQLVDSSNNTMSENTIANNKEGILFAYASNNMIFHNNFINNEKHAVSADLRARANIWDDGYPSGGNYWSCHDCFGNPSNGSQPYVISTLNADRYPFQDPCCSLNPLHYVFEVSWDNETFSIGVESNSSICNLSFHQPAMAIIFNVSGVDGTVGYVNITFPKLLLDVYDSKPPYLWVVVMDRARILIPTTTKNGTHNFLYFTYTHSEHCIDIIGNKAIPEHPLILFASLFMIVFLFIGIAYMRAHAIYSVLTMDEL